MWRANFKLMENYNVNDATFKKGLPINMYSEHTLQKDSYYMSWFPVNGNNPQRIKITKQTYDDIIEKSIEISREFKEKINWNKPKPREKSRSRALMDLVAEGLAPEFECPSHLKNVEYKHFPCIGQCGNVTIILNSPAEAVSQGFNLDSIRKCITGERFHHNGYKFKKYEKDYRRM